MTENIDKTVLMKCQNCGYLEEVPEETLIELKNLPPVSKEYKILCPICLNDMYEANSKRFNNIKDKH